MRALAISVCECVVSCSAFSILSSLFYRNLVLEALSERPEWTATCLRSEGEIIAPEASCSDFHWGEYERIDWERVHQGKSDSQTTVVFLLTKLTPTL